MNIINISLRNLQKEIESPGASRTPGVGRHSFVKPTETFLSEYCRKRAAKTAILRRCCSSIVHCNTNNYETFNYVACETGFEFSLAFQTHEKQIINEASSASL